MIGADRFFDELTEEQQNLHTHQRYARGYSDIDMWNFDQFLKDIVVAGAKHHLKSGGYPWMMDHRGWETILREIRDEFSGGFHTEPSKQAWKLLRKHLPSMGD